MVCHVKDRFPYVLAGRPGFRQNAQVFLGLDITDFAAIVNAGAVVILVFINAYYLKIAKRQTEGTRRSPMRIITSRNF